MCLEHAGQSLEAALPLALAKAEALALLRVHPAMELAREHTLASTEAERLAGLLQKSFTVTTAIFQSELQRRAA